MVKRLNKFNVVAIIVLFLMAFQIIALVTLSSNLLTTTNINNRGKNAVTSKNNAYHHMNNADKSAKSPTTHLPRASITNDTSKFFTENDLIAFSGKVNFTYIVDGNIVTNLHPVGVDVEIFINDVPLDNTYYTGGSPPKTNGTDTNNNYIDDQTDASGSFIEPDDIDAGYYKGSFRLPPKSDWAKYGLSDGQNAIITEFVNSSKYDGTPFQNLPPYNVSTTIRIGSTAEIVASSTPALQNTYNNSNEVWAGLKVSGTFNVRLAGTTSNVNEAIPLSWTLYDSSNTPYTESNSGTIGVTVRDQNNNPVTQTDTTGSVQITIYTSTTTPVGDYRFELKANFSGTSYIGNDPGQETSTINATFKVVTTPDKANIRLISATPQQNFSQPTVWEINYTYQVYATSIWNNQEYPLANVRVNATLFDAPTSGTIEFIDAVPDSFGYALTDSNGYIKIRVTMPYPDVYLPDVFYVNWTVDLTDTTLPPEGNPTPGTSHYYVVGASSNTQIFTASFVYSEDPDYKIAQIYDYQLTTLAGTTKQVNQLTAYMSPDAILQVRVFLTANLNAAEPLANIPYEVIPLDKLPTGVNLTVDNITYDNNTRTGYTDASGYAYYYLVATYSITEEPQNFNELFPTGGFRVQIVFNLTDPSNDNIIGVEHGNTTTPADQAGWFDTWTDGNFTFAIRSPYEFVKFQKITQNTTIPRPGETMYFSYRVYNNATNTPLSDIPVNLTLNVGSLAQNDFVVTLDPSLQQYVSDSNYYNTTSDGIFNFTIKINYPNSLNLSDFTFDIVLTTYNLGVIGSRWLVGETVNIGFNRSQSSYTSITKTVYVKPKYLFAKIDVVSVTPSIVAKGTNSTIVAELNLVNNTNFKLEGYNITLQIVDANTTANFTIVSQAWAITDANGRVTFKVQSKDALPVVSGNYYFLLNASVKTKDFMYNNRLVLRYWLNGTDLNGNDNGAFALARFKIRLEKAEITTLSISSTPTDSSGRTPFEVGGIWHIYRGTTTVPLQVEWVDENGVAATGTLNLYYNTSDGQSHQITGFETLNMDTSPKVFSLTFPTDTPLGQIMLYATSPTAPIQFNNPVNLTIITEVNFVDVNVKITNGAQVAAGDTVIISGFLQDDQGINITNSATGTHRFSWKELNTASALTVKLYDGSGNFMQTIASSIDFNTGGFSRSVLIPTTYTDSKIQIQIVVTGVDIYRSNVTGIYLNTYQSVAYNFTLSTYNPSDGSQQQIASNASTITLMVYDNASSSRVNQSVTLNIRVEDNYNRALSDKQFEYIYKLDSSSTQPSPTSVNADTNGNVVIVLSETASYQAGTLSYTLILYHVLDNGTKLNTSSNVFVLYIQWKLIDDTPPIAEFSNMISGTYVVQGNMVVLGAGAATFAFSVSDPNDNSTNKAIYSGVNEVNATLDSTTQLTVSYNSGTGLYEVAIDLTGTTTETHTITLSISDNSNNQNVTTFTFYVDITAPYLGNLKANLSQSGYIKADDPTATSRIAKVSIEFKDDNTATTAAISGFNLTATSLTINLAGTGITGSFTVPNTVLYENITTVNGREIHYAVTVAFELNITELLAYGDSTTTWTLSITYTDLVGLSNTTQFTFKVDHDLPTVVSTQGQLQENFDNRIQNSYGRRLLSNNTFNYGLTLSDGQSGLLPFDQNAITLTLLNYDTQQNVGSIVLNVTEQNETHVTLSGSFDPTSYADGTYYATLELSDYTGNKLTLNIVFTIQTPQVSKPPTTTQPPSTTTPQGTSSFIDILLNPVDIVTTILSVIAALGAGFGAGFGLDYLRGRGLKWLQERGQKAAESSAQSAAETAENVTEQTTGGND